MSKRIRRFRLEQQLRKLQAGRTYVFETSALPSNNFTPHELMEMMDLGINIFHPEVVSVFTKTDLDYK